ncbi:MULTISPECIES: DUF4365 domain-containing protein [Nocardia]|uniref:DUF4365 domain-containing protein n=1 Tax=Nocardia asteroides NBRC 15531 TaxID=1110697 RepID=U5EPP9_NOCAS|nr:MULTISPECIES: DUF4365 domain-containing protein [Nocardia]TLF63358.1 DUF4365 domain-containing protein [Nocardia asteroides NBRC 15531]UGT47217.1 DUF4365 domain-containing protein [Nocardia asteroides]SFM76019.1 protein of unknown function [Nocardia asteroides]VEG33899.1 Uncharacterised protein [Nocardia asteroides]GAD87059.1 hypothetical protein NCAST_34_01870 [Nocardia asteroides NBRC 15531]
MTVVAVPHPHYGLDLNGAKSRYSLSYLYAVCSQAGCTVIETPQDSDVHSIDATVQFEEGDVRVQMKCSSTHRMTGSQIRFQLKQQWIDKWRKYQGTTFVVLVLVPEHKADWVQYGDDETVHRTQAYWAEFDKSSTAKSIVIPRANRLDTSTLAKWHSAFAVGFGEEAAS